jgi:hypothetical protein
MAPVIDDNYLQRLVLPLFGAPRTEIFGRIITSLGTASMPFVYLEGYKRSMLLASALEG